MNIIEIVEGGLKSKGLDGLVVAGTCGCLIGDISPGNCLSENCDGGYKHTHSQRQTDWVISSNKAPKTDEEIDRIIAECC